MWMGQPLHHPPSCPPHLEPPTCYAEAHVEMWWAREGFASCPDCGPASTRCFPLRPFLQPNGGMLLVPFGPGPFLQVVHGYTPGLSGHGSTSWSPSQPPWCSVTYLPLLLALPPGRVDSPPGRTLCTYSLCYCPFPALAGGTHCSQRLLVAADII